MTNCKRESIYFPSQKGKKVEVNFSGGDVTSDGGVLLLREINRKLGLTKKVSERERCDPSIKSRQKPYKSKSN